MRLAMAMVIALTACGGKSITVQRPPAKCIDKMPPVRDDDLPRYPCPAPLTERDLCFRETPGWDLILYLINLEVWAWTQWKEHGRGTGDPPSSLSPEGDDL